MTKLIPRAGRRGGMRLSLAMLAVVLAACGSQSPSPTNDAPPDVDGSWVLTSGRGPAGVVPLVDAHQVTLTIEGTQVGGVAACNHYGARFTIRGGRLAVEELSSTAIGCDAPIAASEAAYLEALQVVSRAEREGETLILSGPDVELRFAALAEPPTADLVDTIWVLETVVVGNVAAAPLGDRATLELRADGTFSGSTGCRTFDGEWLEKGEQIVATSMSTTDLACPPELVDQDSHVVAVIGDGFVPTVEGTVLTLNDPAGIGLVYRAQE